MPKRGEQFTREPEKEADKEQKNPFVLYCEKGAYNLSGVSEKELPRLVEKYKENFEAIDEQTQVEVLEQFLLLEAIKDETSVLFADKMASEQRAVLGKFIGKAIKPGTYVRTFHKCFSNLDEENRHSFIEHFTSEEPEHAIMVAPFVDLSRIMLEKKEGGWKRTFHRKPLTALRGRISDRMPEETKDCKSIMSWFFGSYEPAQKLMELYFSEDWGEQTVSGGDVNYVIDYYGKTQATFLYPYLPGLLEKGVIDKERAKKILGQWNPAMMYHEMPRLDPGFYKTAKERSEGEKILAKAKKILPGVEDLTELYMEEEKLPRKLRAEQKGVEDKTVRRALKHILGNFREYKDLLGPQEKLNFLGELLERGHPVFAELKSLDLSEVGVKALAAEARQRGAGLFWMTDLSDAKALIDGGYKKLVFDSLKRDILEAGEDVYVTQHLVQNAGTALSWFSEEEREALIKLINKVAPNLWFHNIDYAVREGGVSFKELVQEASADGYAFLDNFTRIIYHARQLKKEGKDETFSLEEAKETARRIFEQKPELAISRQYQKIAREVFSFPELEKLIRANLEGAVDLVFLSRLLGEAAIGKEYRKEVLTILRENPLLFSQYLAEPMGPPPWTRLKEIFSRQEMKKIIKILLDNLDLINVDDLVFQAGFVEDLSSNKKYIEYFLSYLEKHNLAGSLANVIHYIRTIQKPSLTKEEEARYLATEKEARRILIDVCGENPDKVFTRSILKVRDGELLKIVRERAGEYIFLHPEALLDIQGYIYKDDFAKLVRDNLRAAAFICVGLSRDKDKLTPETARLIRRTNPLADLEAKEKLEQDFYQSVLAEIRNFPFFDFYQKELEKIAAEENKKNGPRLDVSYLVPNKEFVELVNRISLLSLSPLAVKNREALAEMSKENFDEFTKLFEFVSLYNLDGGLDVDLKEDKLEESLAKLGRVINQYIGKILGIEVPAKTKIDPKDIELLRVLSIFYRQGAKENRWVEETVRDYAFYVMNGELVNYRVWGVKGEIAEDKKGEYFEKLKEDRLLPQNLTLVQYEKWIQDSQKSIEDVLRLEIGDIQGGIREVLRQAVADHHIGKEELDIDLELVKERYALVVQPITEMNRRMKELKEKIDRIKKRKKMGGSTEKLTPDENAEYEKLRVMIADYRAKNQDEIDKLKAKLYLARLSRLTIRELEEQALITDKKTGRIKFRDIFRTLERAYQNSHPGFVQDVQRLNTNLRDGFNNVFGERRLSKTELTATDAFGAGIYLKIGAEPVETCQHYDSTSRLNLGLLSYSLDPNVKIIQIYSDNRLIARSIIRLLENENGDPKLFLERLYTTNAHEKIRELVVSLAEDKARALGVGLYGHALEGREAPEESEVVDLYSRSSHSAYVYTDAGGGNRRRGVYKISSAFKIA